MFFSQIVFGPLCFIPDFSWREITKAMFPSQVFLRNVSLWLPEMVSLRKILSKVVNWKRDSPFAKGIFNKALSGE